MYHFVSWKFWISDFLVFSLTIFPNQSNNYIKFDFQYISTQTLEATQFPLHKSSEHQTAEQYLGSANCVELDLKSVVNLLATGKLQKSTTVYSQYELFYQPWLWIPPYFDWWYHIKTFPGIVDHIKCNQSHFIKAPCCCWI